MIFFLSLLYFGFLLLWFFLLPRIRITNLLAEYWDEANLALLALEGVKEGAEGKGRVGQMGMDLKILLFWETNLWFFCFSNMFGDVEHQGMIWSRFRA